MPVGTQVFTEDGTLVCDLAHPGARVVIARGGRGGAGNTRFATATRQAPRLAGIGEDGEARTLELHLKLMADAALLGFPNVGKSSLLRRVSNATPKVADYPFTTIDPVLGTVESVDGRQLTVVDVPGPAGGRVRGHRPRPRVPRAPGARPAAAARRLGRARPGRRRARGSRSSTASSRRTGTASRSARASSSSTRSTCCRPRIARRSPRPSPTPIDTGELEADAGVLRGEDGRPLVVAVSCATGEGIADLVAALHRYAPERVAIGVPGDGLADYLVYRPGAGGGVRYRLLREEGGFRVTGLDELAEGIDADDRARRGGARGRARGARRHGRSAPRRRARRRRDPHRQTSPCSSSTTEERSSSDHRRPRLALQPAAPRPPAARQRGGVAARARPGADRAHRRAVAPRGAARDARRCACAWPRRS